MAKLLELFPTVNYVTINWGEHNFHMHHILSQLKDNAEYLATDRGKCYLMEDFTKDNWWMNGRQLTFRRCRQNGKIRHFKSKYGVQYRIEGNTMYL